ncbi:hypothetical protein WMY93_031811 [Mugilogobius chulae]|uniref:Uncharacterized protein n=1 Tax=Mugilogobius chulae TaxID=88201 RepID=A0AAW0MGR2_9GOBI
MWQPSSEAGNGFKQDHTLFFSNSQSEAKIHVPPLFSPQPISSERRIRFTDCRVCLCPHVCSRFSLMIQDFLTGFTDCGDCLSSRLYQVHSIQDLTFHSDDPGPSQTGFRLWSLCLCPDVCSRFTHSIQDLTLLSDDPGLSHRVYRL